MKYTYSHATISDCGLWRYTLERRWDEAGPVLGFLMLNPSTADAVADDSTIRRCVSQARYLGFSGIFVANVFAYRASDPSILQKCHDPVGHWNSDAIRTLVYGCERIICAYGNAPLSDQRSGGLLYGTMRATEGYLREKNVMPWALQINKTGLPAHPVRLRAGLTPVGYLWNSGNEWEPLQ